MKSKNYRCKIEFELNSTKCEVWLLALLRILHYTFNFQASSSTTNFLANLTISNERLQASSLISRQITNGNKMTRVGFSRITMVHLLSGSVTYLLTITSCKLLIQMRDSKHLQISCQITEENYSTRVGM